MITSRVGRSEKFGADYVEPSQRKELLLEAKKERWNREGFSTGFDVFSKVSVPHCPNPHQCGISNFNELSNADHGGNVKRKLNVSSTAFSQASRKSVMHPMHVTYLGCQTHQYAVPYVGPKFERRGEQAALSALRYVTGRPQHWMGSHASARAHGPIDQHLLVVLSVR